MGGRNGRFKMLTLGVPINKPKNLLACKATVLSITPPSRPHVIQCGLLDSYVYLYLQKSTYFPVFCLFLLHAVGSLFLVHNQTDGKNKE